MEIGLHHWLVLSSLLLGIGLYGVLTRRNALLLLMSLELVLNAAAINFVAFNYYLTPNLIKGQVFAIFIIAIAAAEAAIGIAIVIRLYRLRGEIDLTNVTELKW